MKTLHKIDLVFSVNGKTVAIQPIHDWTVPEIVDQIKVVKRMYPERECRIKRRALFRPSIIK